MWSVVLSIFILFSVFLLLAIFLALRVGKLRWGYFTREIRAALEFQRHSISPDEYDPAELEGLPEPVQRFFRAALTPGQPIIAAVRVRHRGEFNSGRRKPAWSVFTSEQLVVTRRPGFDWDARIRMTAGLTFFVHDAYVAGEGILRVAWSGLITIAHQRGNPELNMAEELRFFAEAAWYPTALLPSQGVEWKKLGDSAAFSTLRFGQTSQTLEFHFGDDGLIESIRSENRPRDVEGRLVPTPWRGRFWNYETRDGMRIPTEGEVSWVLENGETPYWRARIEEIEYDWADDHSNE